MRKCGAFVVSRVSEAMARKTRLLVLFGIAGFALAGCIQRSVVKMPESLPSHIKEYKHVIVTMGKGSDTGIFLNEGDLYSILPDAFYKKYLLGERVGKEVLNNARYHGVSRTSGYLYLFTYSNVVIDVDVIVWATQDYGQMAQFLEMMKQKDPGNEVLQAAFDEANRRKEYYLASQKVTEEIADTKKQIDALKTESTPAEPGGRVQKQERIASLEEKLAELEEMQGQLEEMKQKFENERQRAETLQKELVQKEKREQELVAQLRDTTKTPPVIVVASPADKSQAEVRSIFISGVAEDDQGIESLEISVNGQIIKGHSKRGLTTKEGTGPRRIDFREPIQLQGGNNRIQIRVVDSDGLWTEETISVQYAEKGKNIWGVVVGINDYPNTRKLHYAVNDAKAFYEYLVDYNGVPKENITLMLDDQATLTAVKSALGTHLKNKAGKEDMVIIFFAGHGATEKDVASPDGDGLEKYILPYDADVNDLYATALPMADISRIFTRIRSERLVFIADSCYSGASGGRTIDVTGIRANISDAFLERIAGGKGRVIMTASGANEVSAEKDELAHGVFTYFLIEGLRGGADADDDGLITVDEIYQFVSDQVPRATGQEQHPVKKGTVEGKLVLGIVK
jgi:hypothetical protein